MLNAKMQNLTVAVMFTLPVFLLRVYRDVVGTLFYCFVCFGWGALS